MQAKSDTAFGREFIGFSDGKHGINIPRQWDGKYFDRVSSEGPGALSNIQPGPTHGADVTDNSVALVTISRTTGIISASTSAPHNLTVGSLVTIDGVNADPTFNGTFPVISVGSPTTFQAWGSPAQFSANSIQRIANVVSASLVSSQGLNAGDTVVAGGFEDPSFSGQFTLLTVVGNIVTWSQAGPDAHSVFGTVYAQSVKTPVVQVRAFDIGGTLCICELQGSNILGYSVGGQITLAGNNVAGWNSTQNITAVTEADPSYAGEFGNNTTIQFVMAVPPGALGTGGTAQPTLPDSAPAVTGVAGIAGNISPGEHQVSVSFIYRSGYITKPSPSTRWEANGGFQATVATVSTGPSAVVARLLMFTPGDGNNFYYSKVDGPQILSMLIPDNTNTGPFLVDFSDNALINSVSADSLFDLIELPEVSGFIQFANRLLAWGGRNNLPNWENLSFDGGFDGTDTVPLGWLLGGSGGSRGQNSPVWGDYYSITGDGISSVRGLITQSAYQDTFLVNRIKPNTGYSVRVLLWAPGLPPTQGKASIHLSSVSLGLDAGLDVDVSMIVGAFPGVIQEFTGVLTTSLPVVPTDLLLTVSCTNTLTNMTSINFENIKIFPTNQPYNDSVLYGSNPSDPESFQGTTGFQTIAAGNGKRLTTCFEIRDRFYITQNNGGLYEMTADPSADFSDWTVDTISSREGCESINGIGVHDDAVGEDWVFMLDKKGLYIFWSSVPTKVSQENQPIWDSINWPYISTAWLISDVKTRRVLIGVPIGTSQVPNKVLMMDYNMAGASASEIADSPPVSPTFTGQLRAHMRSRKWSIWNIASPGAGFIDRSDNTAHLFLSNSNSSGQIWELSDTLLSDVTGPIFAYYTTGFYPSDEQKAQVLQMKGSRVLLRYLTLLIAGQGNLTVTIASPNNGNSITIPNTLQGTPPIPLNLVPSKDVELYTRFRAERISLTIRANIDGIVPPWFSLQNMWMYMAQDPIAPIRGYNRV